MKLIRFMGSEELRKYLNGETLTNTTECPWDRKTRNSMAGTLQMLRRLAYNIHGVMDVIDDDNVKRLTKWLEGGQE